MSALGMIKLAPQVFGARSSVKDFQKARDESDKLRMLQSVVTLLSVGITVALVIRELREARQSRAVGLEEIR